MTDRDKRPEDAAGLRRRAAEISLRKAAQPPIDLWTLKPEEIQRTFHDLQVHKIELEMQNEELQRSQEELGVSRQQYFDLYDLAPVGYVTLSEKGLILQSNLTAVTMLGVERRALLRQPLNRFILPEDQHIHYQHCRQLFDTRAPQMYELRMLRKDTSFFWARLDATVKQNDAVHEHRVVITNITKRKQAEDLLRESNEYLENLFNYANAPIIVWDPQLRITRFNHAFEALTGRAADEVFGQKLELLFPPARVQRTMELIEKTLQGERWQTVEIEIQHRDGPVRTLLWNSAAIFDAEGQAQIATIAQGYDITERKQAELERERLVTAIEQAGEIVLIMNPEGAVEYVNKAVEQFTGKTREEIKGNKIPVDKRNAEQLKQAWKTATAGKPWSGTITGTKADGTGCDFDLALTPVKNDKGNVSSMVLIGHDISHERQLEEQLRQSQKMEALGTLAGGIAHDFNNILGGILSFAEIVKDKLPQGSQSANHLDQQVKLIDRAANLIQQLLVFSRKTTGSARKPMQLSPLIKEIVSVLRFTLPATIEIRHKLFDQGSLVEADPTQIHQVLMNLCINASHAMQDRAGALEIELTRVSIQRDDTCYKNIEPGPYVLLKVSDTGAGIDPENISRIFDPFFTTKEVGRGTGLGLSVVHGIIKSHGGDIAATSELGKGTTFTILLPEASAPAEIKQEESSSELLTGNEHILLVDDEETILYAVRTLLESLGYKVTAVQGSLEALAVFQNAAEGFDLVITDLTMPHMTGFDLAQQLVIVRPDIPVILSTGYNNKLLDTTEKKESIKAVLIKPFNRKALSETIRKVLDNKPAIVKIDD